MRQPAAGAAGGKCPPQAKILSLFIVNLRTLEVTNDAQQANTRCLLSLVSASDGAQEKELFGIAVLIGNLVAMHRHQPGSFVVEQRLDEKRLRSCR